MTTTDTLREVTLFVPGALWTINAERSMVHWQHRRNTEAIRKAAKLATETLGAEPFADPVILSAWPRTFTGKGDCGCHYGAIKGALDGCVDAGLLVDDTPQWVKAIVQYLPRKVPMKDQGVLLLFRTIES